ncbi:MAG: response regulator transcription factor [Bdellovibrionota bacterium]
MRILVVEDQSKMSQFVKQGLGEVGYAVDLASTCSEANEFTAQTDYDLVILDVMLPDGSGMDFARQLREQKCESPILMLSALSSTKDKVGGLDAGADDYLTKPFSFEELLARVRALLRRKNPTSEASSTLKVGDLEMNLITRRVSRGDQEIQLTTKEFALLEYLVRNAGRPLGRVSIAEHVWDINFDNESNVIDVYINMLRKKVDSPFATKLIHTVVGVGYVLKT